LAEGRRAPRQARAAPGVRALLARGAAWPRQAGLWLADHALDGQTGRDRAHPARHRPAVEAARTASGSDRRSAGCAQLPFLDRDDARRLAGAPRGDVVTTPAVTVLMCAYNAAEYLREAVDSILAQSWRDFELLIIDDGSSDATPAMLAAYDD